MDVLKILNDGGPDSLYTKEAVRVIDTMPLDVYPQRGTVINKIIDEARRVFGGKDLSFAEVAAMCAQVDKFESLQGLDPAVLGEIRKSRGRFLARLSRSGKQSKVGGDFLSFDQVKKQYAEAGQELLRFLANYTLPRRDGFESVKKTLDAAISELIHWFPKIEWGETTSGGQIAEQDFSNEPHIYTFAPEDRDMNLSSGIISSMPEKPGLYTLSSEPVSDEWRQLFLARFVFMYIDRCRTTPEASGDKMYTLLFAKGGDRMVLPLLQMAGECGIRDAKAAKALLTEPTDKALEYLRQSDAAISATPPATLREALERLYTLCAAFYCTQRFKTDLPVLPDLKKLGELWMQKIAAERLSEPRQRKSTIDQQTPIEYRAVLEQYMSALGDLLKKAMTSQTRDATLRKNVDELADFLTKLMSTMVWTETTREGNLPAAWKQPTEHARFAAYHRDAPGWKEMKALVAAGQSHPMTIVAPLRVVSEAASLLLLEEMRPKGSQNVSYASNTSVNSIVPDVATETASYVYGGDRLLEVLKKFFSDHTFADNADFQAFLSDPAQALDCVRSIDATICSEEPASVYEARQRAFNHLHTLLRLHPTDPDFQEVKAKSVSKVHQAVIEPAKLEKIAQLWMQKLASDPIDANNTLTQFDEIRRMYMDGAIAVLNRMKSLPENGDLISGANRQNTIQALERILSTVKWRVSDKNGQVVVGGKLPAAGSPTVIVQHPGYPDIDGQKRVTAFSKDASNKSVIWVHPTPMRSDIAGAQLLTRLMRIDVDLRNDIEAENLVSKTINLGNAAIAGETGTDTCRAVLQGRNISTKAELEAVTLRTSHAVQLFSELNAKLLGDGPQNLHDCSARLEMLLVSCVHALAQGNFLIPEDAHRAISLAWARQKGEPKLIPPARVMAQGKAGLKKVFNGLPAQPTDDCDQRTLDYFRILKERVETAVWMEANSSDQLTALQDGRLNNKNRILAVISDASPLMKRQHDMIDTATLTGALASDAPGRHVFIKPFEMSEEFAGVYILWMLALSEFRDSKQLALGTRDPETEMAGITVKMDAANLVSHGKLFKATASIVAQMGIATDQQLVDFIEQRPEMFALIAQECNAALSPQPAQSLEETQMRHLLYVSCLWRSVQCTISPELGDATNARLDVAAMHTAKLEMGIADIPEDEPAIPASAVLTFDQTVTQFREAIAVVTERLKSCNVSDAKLGPIIRALHDHLVKYSLSNEIQWINATASGEVNMSDLAPEKQNITRIIVGGVQQEAGDDIPFIFCSARASEEIKDVPGIKPVRLPKAYAGIALATQILRLVGSERPVSTPGFSTLTIGQAQSSAAEPSSFHKETATLPMMYAYGGEPFITSAREFLATAKPASEEALVRYFSSDTATTLQIIQRLDGYISRPPPTFLADAYERARLCMLALIALYRFQNPAANRPAVTVSENNITLIAKAWMADLVRKNRWHAATDKSLNALPPESMLKKNWNAVEMLRAKCLSSSHSDEHSGRIQDLETLLDMVTCISWQHHNPKTFKDTVIAESLEPGLVFAEAIPAKLLTTTEIGLFIEENAKPLMTILRNVQITDEWTAIALCAQLAVMMEKWMKRKKPADAPKWESLIHNAPIAAAHVFSNQNFFPGMQKKVLTLQLDNLKALRAYVNDPNRCIPDIDLATRCVIDAPPQSAEEAEARVSTYIRCFLAFTHKGWGGAMPLVKKEELTNDIFKRVPHLATAWMKKLESNRTTPSQTPSGILAKVQALQQHVASKGDPDNLLLETVRELARATVTGPHDGKTLIELFDAIDRHAVDLVKKATPGGPETGGNPEYFALNAALQGIVDLYCTQ